jgi:mannosyl-3-phosphoglycerate phosphatase
MIVFTDLDGTLLDHTTYSWEPAAAALRQLRLRKIPVILSSSKTLAEMDEIRADLDLQHPVIAENGAVIDVPPGYFSVDVPPLPAQPARAELQRVLIELRQAQGYACEAFFEMGVEGIVAETGLAPTDAAKANERRATEPLLWQDTEERLASFTAAVQERGLRCIRGGRFVHLMGPTDKASAMRSLLHAFAQELPSETWTSIALGDSPNDRGMLRCADIAIVIKSQGAQALDLADHPHVIRTKLPGPEGWNSAMLQVLGFSS